MTKTLSQVCTEKSFEMYGLHMKAIVFSWVYILSIPNCLVIIYIQCVHYNLHQSPY